MNKCRKIVPGSVLGLICPSGHPSTQEEVYKFLNLLEEHGYKYKIGNSVFAVEGYLAGSDKLRAEDVMSMFKDDEVDAILCYKGGYGAQRMLPYLDFNEIKKHPKLLVGFSDVTVLLNTLYQFAEMPSLHGEMGVCMQKYEEFTFNHFFDTLANGITKPLVNPTLPLNVISEGITEGVLVGGNLSLIYALMGTSYELDLKDKILFIEEVHEAPYAVDRMLSSLLLSGKLNQVKGIICGYFTGCESSANQTVDELLVHYFKPLGVPVVSNFQSGHDKPFINVPVGLNVKLNTYEKSVTVLESLFLDK